MKKLTALTGIITIGLMLQAQVSLAQTLNTVGTLSNVLSSQPNPSGGSITTLGTTTTTTTTGGATTTTSSTGGKTTTRTPATNVTPATDIPIVPSGVNQQPLTTSDGQGSTLVCNQDRCAATLQQAMGNEIIVMTIFFFGSGIGGLSWVLALLASKKSVVDREGRRMERQNRAHFEKMLTNEKTKNYNNYIDSVMDIVEKLQHKKTLGAADLKSFQAGSAYINLTGSQDLRSMNDHISGLIDKGKPLTSADYSHLKTELGKTAKADLMIDMTSPQTA